MRNGSAPPEVLPARLAAPSPRRQGNRHVYRVAPTGNGHHPDSAEGGAQQAQATAVLGYGLGDFGSNLAFTMGSTFLLYYYTDVAGLSAAAVGTMFLIVRLWDAFADLIAGRAVDRTMTRRGKFRPFILFGAVPLLFLSFLTFHVPDADIGTKLLYAYLTYAVLGLAYSLVNIPYGSLALAMTQPVHERAKLVSARTLGSVSGGLVLTFIISPMISDLKKQKQMLAPRGLTRQGAAHLHGHHPGVHRDRLAGVLPDLPVVS